MANLLKSTVFTLMFVFAVSFITGYFSEIAHVPAELSGAFMISTVTTVIGLITMACFAIPLHIFLKSKHMHSVSWYIASGFIPGIVLVFVFRFFGNDTILAQMQQAALLGAFGASAAMVFWYFSKDCKP